VRTWLTALCFVSLRSPPQAKDSGFICGAFTPLQWPAAQSRGYTADGHSSGRTFLFSLVNAHGRPVRLRAGGW